MFLDNGNIGDDEASCFDLGREVDTRCNRPEAACNFVDLLELLFNGPEMVAEALVHLLQGSGVGAIVMLFFLSGNSGSFW